MFAWVYCEVRSVSASSRINKTNITLNRNLKTRLADVVSIQKRKKTKYGISTIGRITLKYWSLIRFNELSSMKR